MKMSSLLGAFLARWICGCVVLTITVVISAPASVDSSQLNIREVNDDLVTLRCENERLVKVLEQVAHEAGLEIYLFEMPNNVAIQCNIIEAPLGDVLRRLLRDCSYAVIYAPRQTNTTGIRLVEREENAGGLGKSVRSRIRSDVNRAASFSDASSEREVTLGKRIQVLERRIDSGASDRDYEKWVRVRGEEFAIHDRERLQRYQEELDAL